MQELQNDVCLVLFSCVRNKTTALWNFRFVAFWRAFLHKTRNICAILRTR